MSLAVQIKEYNMLFDENDPELNNVWNTSITKAAGNFISPDRFDIARSLHEAPALKQNGMIWKTRKVLHIENDCVIDTEHQARHKGTHAEHRNDIRDSFENNGWIYTQSPPIVVWDEKIGKYILHDGFTRTNTLGELGCEYVVADIYVPKNPLALEILKLKANQNHLPKRGSDQGDIINSALKCIKDKFLANDQKSVESFVNETASHLSKSRRQSIINDIMNRQGNSKYKTYLMKGVGDHNLTNNAKNVLEIPYGGDANYTDTGYFGYVTTEKTARMTISNSIKLLKQVLDDMRTGTGAYSHLTELPEVRIFAYFESPGKKDLREQRLDWLQAFQSTLDSIVAICEYMTDSKSKKKFPIKFGGFLPQLIDADPTKNGEKKETTIVDANGKPFNWKK
jgi:hypothetical protein